MSSTSKTTTENKPPEWAAPLYSEIGKDALDLYNSGTGLTPYPGSTVADYSPTTLAGINALTQAGGNWDTSATRGQFGELAQKAQNNPFTSLLQQAANGKLFKNAEGSANAIGTLADKIFGSEGGILSQYAKPSASSQNLQASARGDYLKDGNPFFEQQLANTLDDVQARTKSTISGQGRYGSDYHVDTLADTLADQAIGARSDQWNNERNWQLQSNSLIDAAEAARLTGATNAGNAYVGAYGDRANAQNALLGTQGSLLSAGANAYGQGIGQALDATGSMRDIDQQQFINELTGAESVLKAGGLLDNKSQAQLDDYVNLWTAMENQEWDRMAAATSLAGGVAGPYGVQNSRSKSSNPAAFLGALGGLK